MTAFTPIRLRNITLPGRIARSATELFCSEPDGHVYNYEYGVFDELSRHPFGLIIASHTCVSPEGRSNPWQNGIWSDEFIPDQTRIAQAAKQNGVPCILQIGHGGMKAKENNGGRPVYTPDNMTKAQIADVVNAFGAAGARAKQCGFDGVMLHGAHMYLLSQFFYPEVNHRTDEYGGSARNRFRITEEAFLAVKKCAGDDFPVFMKINGDDKNGSEEYTRDLAEVLRLCNILGMDAAEISGYDSARKGRPDKPYFFETVKRLREECDIPLIEVGGIRTKEEIERILASGIEMVSMSRPVLCQPDVIERLWNGEAVKCTGCCYCFNPFDKAGGIRCPNGKR